jgi:hypothetical protein
MLLLGARIYVPGEFLRDPASNWIRPFVDARPWLSQYCCWTDS